jgi:putative ABC transport system permease protein
MRWFGWLRRSRLDDLSEEIRSHIEEKTDALIATGLSRADAEREARRAFGNVTQVKEAAGDVWRLESFLHDVASDVRYALRGLLQKPGFTIAVILTLALGIGANAVVFALVNAIVLRPLPYPDSDRLISISQAGSNLRDGRVLHEIPYVDWTRVTQTVAAYAAYGGKTAVVSTPDGPTRIEGLGATPAYFGIFGVRPLMGRTFDESEALPGGPKVVVLSEPLWREQFGGDSAMIGKSVTIDGVSRQVIGILPASFTLGRSERFWTPLRVAPERKPPGPGGEWGYAYSVVARLRAGTGLEAVRAEVAIVMDRLKQQGYGQNVGIPVVMTLHERRHGDTRRPLLLLFGAVGVLLLTACANIANLALARAARREREFALRLALGASRWRVVRFVLIENLALAAGGALVGLLLVRLSLGWFVRISPDSIRTAGAIGVSGALVMYASMVAVLTAIVFGLLPAIAASRATPNTTLATATQHAAGSLRQSRARHVLVVGELAVALVFLTGAGLVAKTFWRATSVDPGFRPENVVAVHFALGDRYSPAAAGAFFDELLVRMRRLPGMQIAAYAQGAPLTGGGAMGFRGRGPAGGPPVEFRYANVDPEYFGAIGATLVNGRFIGPEDRAGAPRVVVVTEEFVRVNLEGGSAVGQTMRIPVAGKMPSAPTTIADATIVGVVKDVMQEPTDGKRPPLVFFPRAQTPARTFLSMVVRATTAPAQLEAQIREAVKALDPLQPPPKFRTMAQALAEATQVAPRWFTLVLLVAFAALAGGLAVIGLYSTLAYLVAERTREIGIRIAIGADAGRVRRMILGHGFRLTLAGLVLGGLASMAAVRVLRAWMYEMSVYDAPTLAAVVVLLCVVALLASWLPARRASRVDPVLALRAE